MCKSILKGNEEEEIKSSKGSSNITHCIRTERESVCVWDIMRVLREREREKK